MWIRGLGHEVLGFSASTATRRRPFCWLTVCFVSVRLFYFHLSAVVEVLVSHTDKALVCGLFVIVYTVVVILTDCFFHLCASSQLSLYEHLSQGDVRKFFSKVEKTLVPFCHESSHVVSFEPDVVQFLVAHGGKIICRLLKFTQHQQHDLSSIWWENWAPGLDFQVLEVSSKVS